MIRRPPRSTLDRSSAASDVYKRQLVKLVQPTSKAKYVQFVTLKDSSQMPGQRSWALDLSLIHISEPTRPY